MTSPAPDPLSPVPLGSTGLTVSRLGFGTAPLATVFWGNDEERAVATAAHALDAGIRLFDTAPLYGLGEAESRLGAALAAAPADVVVATKVGRVVTVGADGERDVHFDFSYDGVMRSFASSLERLGVDRVGIVHIHDPDAHLAEATDGAYRAAAELRRQGVATAISLGTMVVATAEHFLRHTDLDCLMVAGRLTLLDRSAVAVAAECRDRGIAFLAAGPFNSGVLARSEPGAWFDYAPASAPVLARVEALRGVCATHGVSLRDAALHYPLAQAGVTALIVGMSTPAEVDANLASLRKAIPPELWAEVEGVDG